MLMWFVLSVNCKYGADLAKQLAASVLSILGTCGSVKISFSKRTPQKVSNVIVRELGTNPKVYIWDGQEPNPRIGDLAWADAFVIAADSISVKMRLVALGSLSMLWGLSVDGSSQNSGNHRERRGGSIIYRVRETNYQISESWSYPPLNDTADATRRVHKALAERGWKLKTLNYNLKFLILSTIASKECNIRIDVRLRLVNGKRSWRVFWHLCAG
ncbi:hypothetical protein L6164_022138 [Bauhinia variegata]|uniref:Uncharacterized protein n=1 Tax=Bauhinia variegata TaxID=167791 RepID=A0ACB9MG16_BAUVA|nr:hypothetical protein L6164_022138 [Bauhinia variegata]